MDKGVNVNEKKKHLSTEMRVLKVAKYILDGYSKRAFLIHAISENEDWNVSERQIDTYISKARDLIKNSTSESELKLEKDIAVNRLEALYVMNMKIQDFKGAESVTMNRMKLLGLLTEKTDITTKGKEIVNIDPSFADAEIKRLVAEKASKLNKE